MIGVLMQFCAAIGEANTHCDVRVKYDTAYTSVEQCEAFVEPQVERMAKGMVKHQPELVIYSQSGKCYTQDALKVKLNDLPEFMEAIGRTYDMTFY